MLHIINTSPYQQPHLQECLPHLKKNDCLILIADGVYAGLAGTKFYQLLSEKIANTSLYALQEDILARGVQAKIAPTIQIINYNEFVVLTIKYHPCYTWM